MTDDPPEFLNVTVIGGGALWSGRAHRTGEVDDEGLTVYQVPIVPEAMPLLSSDDVHVHVDVMPARSSLRFTVLVEGDG